MQSPSLNLAVAPDASYLTIDLASGPARYHAFWLRDNARDSETLSPTNGQRLITLLEQPENPVVRRAIIQEQSLVIQFVNDPVEYRFPLAWLEEHRYDKAPPSKPGWLGANLQLWDSSLSNDLPAADYGEIKNDNTALLTWLRQVRDLGFSTLQGLEAQPDELLEVASLFGYTRETNYGKRFDVRTEVDANNLAYTSAGLQAHTDNPYRDPVPTLQILACLINATDGGDSVLVDGYHAASILQQEKPEHFELLTRYCANFHYSGSDNTHLSAKKPMLELSPDGELTAVRFNNRSAAPFTNIPFNEMKAYYQAYRHFAEILERKDLQVHFSLNPGELFIVNNTRVLHARTGFSGTGERWLQGCYPDIDGLLSTIAVLEKLTQPEV